MAKVALDPGTYSAQRSGAIHKWVNDKTPGADAVVLTDATLYHDLAEGEVVMITAMHFDMETVSDDCHFNMVSCDEIAGGGDATDISGHVHIFTGTVVTGAESKERPLIPPIRVRYASGARSISMKVDANDAAAVVSCGWNGYKDLSLSA